MKNNLSNLVFRKYYLFCSLIITGYIAIIIPIVYFKLSFWSIAISAVLYFHAKILIRTVANSTIASVLFNNLDAPQFQQIINDNKHFNPPLSYRINAAAFTGDYQTIVNIASFQMQKKRCSVREKYFYLSLLARAYFELRDFEKLKALLAKYEELKMLYPSKTFLTTPNSAWSYYRYFLEQNYESCKTVCKERNLGLKLKAWDTQIRKLQNDFYYAVACYSTGDMENAKKTFESIISDAPKIHLSEISRKYLDAIKTNSEITVFEEIVPEKNYQLYDSRTTKKIHRHKIITVILLIIVSSSIITSSVFDYMEKKKQEQHQEIYNSALAEYETKLNNALSKHYDNAIFVKYFPFSCFIKNSFSTRPLI